MQIAVKLSVFMVQDAQRAARSIGGCHCGDDHVRQFRLAGNGLRRIQYLSSADADDGGAALCFGFRGNLVHLFPGAFAGENVIKQLIILSVEAFVQRGANALGAGLTDNDHQSIPHPLQMLIQLCQDAAALYIFCGAFQYFAHVDSP